MEVPKSFEDSFKFWIDWKEQATKSLKSRWAIEDTGILIAFFEQTVKFGLCSPREADKQVTKVIKPTRLSLVSMAKYFHAQVLLSESRDQSLRSFLLFDGLVSYLERHYHPQSPALIESAEKLFPYLEDYRQELASICDIYGRPYLLPKRFWMSYQPRLTGFTPSRPLMRHFMNKSPNLHPQTIEDVDFFRKHAQSTLRNYHLRLKSKSLKRKKLLASLQMPADEIPYLLNHLEEKLLATCSRAEILDHFFVLEGLLICAEEHWLRPINESQIRFNELREHLLEGFSLNELEDYISIFKRPYLLLDA
ncbi:MAG: hypothetical protein CMH49_09885 [Myxococcales bacterium]|nr:hypothetical protein [Myxococcales bacterium]